MIKLCAVGFKDFIYFHSRISQLLTDSQPLSQALKAHIKSVAPEELCEDWKLYPKDDASIGDAVFQEA